MFNIVLVEPLIPQNTGNIGRLCVATNSSLHLVEPLGFDISEKSVRRSGLDYWKFLSVKTHSSYESFRKSIPSTCGAWFISKFGKTSIYNKEISFCPGDYLIFGKETTGLPTRVFEAEKKMNILSIPMFSENIRCLNLSNAVSIVTYEAIRRAEI